jgi:MYXO-CTERM domain-containing protein
MKKLVIASVLAAVPQTAAAFCGFYVEGSGKQLYADATQVVMMRMGTRTVLAMQNDYKGPPEAFAMVIPVPVVLHEGDVKTLAKAVFDKVEQMSAPRLVEYWELDPCSEPITPDYAMPAATAMEGAAGGAPDDKKDLGVKIEAKFTVAEYQIVILSAKDSTGLDTWLRREKYQIPAGAEPLLRPYVEGGMKFFVAKVDPTKVKFVEGRAALSPLRFHYDSDDFSLPIRLGLANSAGTQDLIVNILAPHQRYQVANYPNATIPTNLDVKESMKDRFAEFYAALFDKTLERNSRAVITEYAWDAASCDPCPGPNLDPGDFATLGADVLGGSQDKPQPYQGYDLVLTRLHARYGKDLKDDLRFKEAPPIVGGREHVVSNGQLEEGAKPDAINNFQARYAIRHPWTGPIACTNPKRGRWGGPDGREQPNAPQPAVQLAFAKRDAVQLPLAIAKDIPELGVKAGVVTPTNFGGGSPPVRPADDSVTPKPQKKSGCGCESSDSGGLAMLGAVGFMLLRRRRPAIRGAR